MATYTPQTKIAGASLGSADAWYDWAKANGAARLPDVRQYLDTIYEWAPKCNLKAHAIVTQSIHETGDGTVGWVSYWWRQRCNPAGIGITGDTAQNNASKTFADGREAALAHIVHAYLYVHGTDLPAGLTTEMDPRWRNAASVDTIPGQKTTLASFGAAPPVITWAADPKYGELWAAWLNRTATLFEGTVVTPPAGDGTGGPSKEPSMEYTAYRFPGAPRDAYLPAWINVSIRPVDHPRVRSYQKAPNKRYTTVHDTGNPRTNAEGEYAWLAGGRQGGEVGGYEWINDDKILIITGYFDEVVWAQGTPDGNRLSEAGELAYGGSVVWNDALEICCAMHGAVIEMRGWNANDAAVLHQWWYGKWCAAQILNRGIWALVKQKITNYAALAAQARKGGVTIPAPTVYATPVPVVDPATNLPWDGKADVTINGNVYEAQKITAPVVNGPLNRRQWAGTESQLTGAAIPTGDAIDLLGWVKGELVDGISEWWVDTDGNRLWAGGFDVEPKQVEDWPELPSELPPGMTGVNGHAYYPLYPDDLTDEDEAALDGAAPPLGRKITVKQDGKLYKWANPTSGEVGEVKAGDEVVFKYWTRGEPQTTTAPDGTEFEEVIWYAQNLHTGGRMWAGLSDEKPD